MRLGSLCSGIGGLELGLERAGLGTTAWQCEYDPHASEVLARHWDVPNHGDVKSTDWSKVEPVDVICAGYPCQPFSTAGRRQGTDDDRHLWPFVRDAIRDVGPRLVVLENVRGHLSLGFPEVLGDLADLGFDAGWCLLRASDVGAPHQRARLFVAAYADNVGLERDGRPRDGRAGSADASRRPAPADTDRDQEPVHHSRQTRGGVGERDFRLDAGGRVLGDRLPILGPRKDWRLTRPDGTVIDYGPAVARWDHLLRPHPSPTEPDGNGKPRLSPAFVEWMMGFPEGWVDGLRRTAALRCLGNAVVPQVAEMVGRMILGSGGGAVPPLLPTPTAERVGQRLDVQMSGDGREVPNKLGWVVGVKELAA